MSLKPKVMVTEEVITLIQKYETRKNALELKLEKEKRRLDQVHQVLQENSLLEGKAKVLINEFLMLQSSLWTKNKDFYPETRLAILQKAVDLLASSSAGSAKKDK